MKRMADVARIRTWKDNTEDSERLKNIPENTIETIWQGIFNGEKCLTLE